MWQKEERKKIVENNPGMIFTEVSSELGRLWKLVSKEGKEEYKKIAKIHNDKLKEKNLKDHPEESVTLEEEAGPSPVIEEPLVAEGAVTVEVITDEFDEESVTLEEEAGPSPVIERPLVTNSPIIAEGAVTNEVIIEEFDAEIDNFINLTNDNHIDADMLMDISIQNLDQNSVEPPKKKKKHMAIENSCPLCDFSGESNLELANHMKIQHRMTQSTFNKCKVCGEIFIKEDKLVEHMLSVHPQHIVAESRDRPVEVEVAEPTQEPGLLGEGQGDKEGEATEIVLVKLKKLSWPAVVLKREGDIFEVKMISDDKVRIVNVADIEDFAMEKIVNTKNSRLRTAFVKAADMLKKE